MGYRFFLFVLLAVFCFGCPSAPSSLKDAKERDLFQDNFEQEDESSFDSGQTSLPPDSGQASLPPDTDMDAGTSNSDGTTPTDAGSPNTSVTDSGIDPLEPEPYIPCEGEWTAFVDGGWLPTTETSDGGEESDDRYWSCDLQFLQTLIDNSGFSMGPLELGTQSWTNGRLTAFSAYNAGISGNLTSRVGDVTELANLLLSRNDLSGPIPPSIGLLTRLTALNLSSNKLTGSIPNELGNLTKLVSLTLTSNMLTGTLPAEALGQLVDLKTLLITHNDLEGPIPDTITTLTKLMYIELFRNNLTGPIPNDIGNLTELKNFSVSFNALSGPIPSSFYNLSNLTRIWIRENKLEGVIPEDICSLDIEWSGDSFSIDNNHFCPPYPSCIAEFMETQDTSGCD